MAGQKTLYMHHSPVDWKDPCGGRGSVLTGGGTSRWYGPDGAMVCAAVSTYPNSPVGGLFFARMPRLGEEASGGPVFTDAHLTAGRRIVFLARWNIAIVSSTKSGSAAEMSSEQAHLVWKRNRARAPYIVNRVPREGFWRL
jgi:hypothetical protein